MFVTAYSHAQATGPYHRWDSQSQTCLVLSRRRFEDATVKSIRGNVETRMNRLLRRMKHAVMLVLAMAGLLRLELTKTRTDVDFLPLNPEVFIPAAGQGALSVECRENDEMVLDLLRAIHHEPTAVVTAERTTFLQESKAVVECP